MTLVRLPAILLLCALPGPAAAQTWADAYRAGAYQKAADLLHPMVLDQDRLLASGDPAPARHLALLYARGLGVARDPIGACALAEIAAMIAEIAPPADTQDIFSHQESLAESQQFVREHCDGLIQSERLAASRSMGCWAFGMPEEVLTLGGKAIRAGRGGIHLADAPEEDAAPDLGCPQLVARLRPRAIDPPPDAAPGVGARHFVELLDWQLVKHPSDSAPRYLLHWQLYELRGNKIDVVAREHLCSIDTSPRPVLPPDIDTRLQVEMIRSGHIRWRMSGAPRKRGWVMLPGSEMR